MIIVDTELRRRQTDGDPIRVGMVGAGFMGQGVANQIVNSTPGMELVAISNRNADKAEAAYTYAGVETVKRAGSAADVDAAIAAGVPAVTDDPFALTRADGIDVICEVTGAIEFGAHVVMDCIDQGKHVVLMNAEVDGTVGPILKRRADAAGVIVSGCDGDQPGVQMNLYRFVANMGLEPLVIGNIKGLHDPYRNPTTQEGFARQWGQNPWMVTSFADGTKISFEQAIVANATGFTVARQGMLGQDFDGQIDDATAMFDVDALREHGGIVDYLVKTRPGPGVFVFAAHDDPRQQHYLNLYKLGEGPLYSFYTPYHLCHFEVPNTCARVMLGDAALVPLDRPHVDVVAAAKIDLAAGTTVDGLGGYHTYGLADTAEATAAGDLLPMGVAEGCRLVRDVPKDAVLTYADVELPEGRLIDRLRAEQAAAFPLG